MTPTLTPHASRVWLARGALKAAVVAHGLLVKQDAPLADRKAAEDVWEDARRHYVDTLEAFFTEASRCPTCREANLDGKEHVCPHNRTTAP